MSPSHKLLIHNNSCYTLHQAEEITNNSLVILFIHGIGESGLCFREATRNNELLKLGALIIPDLPGFGASCHEDVTHQADYVTIAIEFLLAVLKRVSKKSNKIALVSHSAGNIIALSLIPHILPHLIAYIDLDGLYEKEPWRYSSYVNQSKSPADFYVGAQENLAREISASSEKCLLRYYSSFVRSNEYAFYQYAKAAQIFIEHRQHHLALAKGKHLFIASRKIRKNLIDFLKIQGVQTLTVDFNHWIMMEDPTGIYEKVAQWIRSCAGMGYFYS